jgi:hypothetical protein
MAISFEQAVIDVWRQALVENAEVVVLGTERYPVRLTPKRRLPYYDRFSADPTWPDLGDP